MKRYILIANEAKDTEFMYADFSFEDNMSLLLFNYSKLRIGMIKCLDMLGIKNTAFVYRTLFRHIFNKTIDYQLLNVKKEEIVFIILARAYEKYGHHLVSHLREHYTSCKIVLYLTDLIHNMRFSLGEAKKEFDIICSLDEREAMNNGIHYVMEPFSSKLLTRIEKVEVPLYDISFVGAAKGRYDKIMRLYNALSKEGLKCDFYIVGVEREKQVKADGIHYDYLDFEEVLKRVANSRCVVEIMQEGMYSATTRYAEAMLLEKNLITDCPALHEDDNIFKFDDNTRFPADTLRAKKHIEIDRYIEMFSINAFIDRIDEHLSQSRT